MFRSPPATVTRPGGWQAHPTCFCLSVSLFCSSVPLIPAGPGSPLGYLTPASSCSPRVSREVSSKRGGRVSGRCHLREAEPAAACRVQASGLVCPSPVSGTRFPPQCSPGFPDVSSAPQVSASAQAAASSPDLPVLRPPLPHLLPSRDPLPAAAPPCVTPAGPQEPPLGSRPAGTDLEQGSSPHLLRALQEPPLSRPHPWPPLRSTGPPH